MTDDLKTHLSKFNLKEDSIEKIESFLSEKILGHTRTTLSISPNGLFRARVINDVNEEDLNTPKSIWYPDWKEIDAKKYRFGRVTDKGCNFFYSSNYLGATIKELRPKNGDRILIGIFHLKFPGTKIKSQFAGIEAVRKTKLFSLLNNFSYANNDDEIIENFFSEKFQEKIDDTEDYKYKITIAFSNILLKNPEIGCLIYPSVASNLQYVNFGIKPDIVDEHFYCQAMYTFIVRRDVRGYTLVPEMFTKKIIPTDKEAKYFEAKWQKIKKRGQKKFKRYSL